MSAEHELNTARPVEPPPLCEPLEQAWSLGKVRAIVHLFGPAAIVASVAIGAGETIVVVRCGAWAGYDLQWLVLVSVVVKGVFVTYLLGRYTAVSGEPIGQRLARLPGPRGWLPLSIVALEMLAAGPLFAAVAKPCGELLRFLMLSPDAPAAWAPAISTAFVAAALVVSLLLSYERLERQQVVICGVLVAGTIIGTVLVRPDLTAALQGLFAIGRLPDAPSWAPDDVRSSQGLTLARTFGYVGGSVLGYVVYADFIMMRRWGMTGHPQIESIRRRAAAGRPGDYLPTDAKAIASVKRSLAPLKWDVGLGAVVLLVVAASFMIAGAAVLHPKLASGELTEVFSDQRLLTDQASIWRQIHPSLVWVYYICVLTALWGTLQAFPEIYSRSIVDFGQAIWPQRSWSFPRVRAVVVAYVMIATTTVLWSGADFNLLTYVTAFLTTNLAVALAMVAALLLNFQLPAAYRIGPLALTGGVAAGACLFYVSWVSGVGLWARFFG